MGITPGLLRLSAGIEHPRDIIGDPAGCVFDATLTQVNGELVKGADMERVLRFVSQSFERLGRWEAGFDWDQMRHIFSTNAKTLTRPSSSKWLLDTISAGAYPCGSSRNRPGRNP